MYLCSIFSRPRGPYTHTHSHILEWTSCHNAFSTSRDHNHKIMVRTETRQILEKNKLLKTVLVNGLQLSCSHTHSSVPASGQYYEISWHGKLTFCKSNGKKIKFPNLNVYKHCKVTLKYKSEFKFITTLHMQIKKNSTQY